MITADLPGPTDPRPRSAPLVVRVSCGEKVSAADDAYSDRIRCDHPTVSDGEALGEALLRAARTRGRGRVVVLAPAPLRPGLEEAGLRLEASLPGFYRGEGECAVLGAALDPSRAHPAADGAARAVDGLVAAPPPERPRPPVATRRAAALDAAGIAGLIADTFDHYPTPSGVPGYIEQQLADGVPFRVVTEGDAVVACASADLVRGAETAELTDCATRPDHRGRGLMQALLAGLMDDLRGLRYPTAFTLARAIEPGMNLVFARLGFAWRGRMPSSCRIGTGLEDINVWSRAL